MKKLAAIAAAAILVCSTIGTPAVAMTHGDIDSVIIFTTDNYIEVGRWTVYCDGHVETEGEMTYVYQTIPYGCPG